MRDYADPTDGGGGPIVTPDPQPDPTPTPVPTPAPTPTPAPSAPYRPVNPPPVPLPALPRPELPAPPAPIGAPRFSADDYAGAARALLPRGRAWPDDPDSTQSKVLSALGGAFERSDAAGNTLLQGALPGSALSGFLPEWEATLGLPDPCAGETPSFAARAAQVRARFTDGGGQSRQRYVTYAASLGFEISIRNYGPFRTGQSSIAEPIADEAWTFTWGVIVQSSTGDTDLAVLLCELEAIKPAGTTIVVDFAEGAVRRREGGAIWLNEDGSPHLSEPNP